jgi:hypothetical protein
VRITEFHVTPIARADPPLLNAAGLHAPFGLRTIVELDRAASMPHCQSERSSKFPPRARNSVPCPVFSFVSR